jgi:mannose-6-phosphate isomerase-like protein (cupin superfamily)
MSLDVININQAVRQTDQPFTLIELAIAGEIVLHGYVCLGAVNWHKHIDTDEVFLVLDGAMALESEWGAVMLHANELAVVPKGISHRSGSQLRTTVVLMHARGVPERRNGHRRIFGIPGAGHLAKAQLHKIASRAAPFRLTPLLNVDEYTLQLATGDGVASPYANDLSESVWMVLGGRVRLDTDDGAVELAQGELAVVSRGVTCHWSGSGQTMLLWLGMVEPYTADRP